jgi:hypothetical protein
VRFRDGKLTLFRDPDEVLVLHTWPQLEAVKKPSAREPWREFNPVFRLLKPRETGAGEADFGPTTLVVNAVDPAYEKLRAFLSFRQSVPRDVAKVIEGFTNRQWTLMRVCVARPQALDLFAQNPALGFSLAHYGRLLGAAGSEIERAASISAHNQRSIARWLGFPDSNATVKILSKIRPELVSLEVVTGLKEPLHDPEVHKALGHLPAINAGVVGLVTHPARFQRIAPKLLQEVAERPDERIQSRVVPLLQDVRRLESILLREDIAAPISSIARLERRHAELTGEYLRFEQQIAAHDKLPAPPIPGTKDIQPLMTASDLIKEGRQQHNCVGSYADSVRAGRVYIYRVTRPERATLSIMRGPGGDWVIQQLFLACNQHVQPETEASVLKWLSGESTGL